MNKVLEKWDKEEQKREELEREAVAFWNQTDPDFIGLENGKWYDLVNNNETPLEQLNDAYIKTFNKSCKEPEKEWWTKVKSKDRRDNAKKKEGWKDHRSKKKTYKKVEKCKVQSSLGFNKPVQKTSTSTNSKKKISFADGTKPPKDDESTSSSDKRTEEPKAVLEIQYSNTLFKLLNLEQCKRSPF